MSDGIERLLRESHPPAGMLASPIPQYRNPDTGDPEPVEGQKGSPFATLLDADGNPISPATTNKQDDIINALETLASTLGTETTLAAVLQALQGTLDVSGNVGVSGSVDVSNRAERELGKVTLMGQIPAPVEPWPMNLVHQIEEVTVATGVQVTAGATANLTPIVDLRSYTWVLAHVRAENAHPFTVMQRVEDSQGHAYAFTSVITRGTAESRFVMGRRHVNRASFGRFAIRNDDVVDRKYEAIAVLGGKTGEAEPQSGG